MIAAIAIDSLDLALVALLLGLNAAVSIGFQLGLERKLAIAAARALVQLLLLGMVLEFVFESATAPLVLAMMIAMCLLAGWEAVQRTTHRARGMGALSAGTLLACGMGVTFYGTTAVIGVAPWWEPRYVIPILGMMLGNTLTGVSLGLETALAGYRERQQEIELLLAHGATRAEAARGVVRRAVRTGSIPILNAMAAAGLISIPGMMTGQILGGEDPFDAALYQIFIFFSIAGSTALGTLAVALLSRRLVFDERDRLRVERIEVRGD